MSKDTNNPHGASVDGKDTNGTVGGQIAGAIVAVTGEVVEKVGIPGLTPPNSMLGAGLKGISVVAPIAYQELDRRIGHSVRRAVTWFVDLVTIRAEAAGVDAEGVDAQQQLDAAIADILRYGWETERVELFADVVSGTLGMGSHRGIKARAERLRRVIRDLSHLGVIVFGEICRLDLFENERLYLREGPDGPLADFEKEDVRAALEDLNLKGLLGSISLARAGRSSQQTLAVRAMT